MSWEERNEATNKVGPKKHLLINLDRAHKTKKKEQQCVITRAAGLDWTGLDWNGRENKKIKCRKEK
jgi:hypothetical protein